MESLSQRTPQRAAVRGNETYLEVVRERSRYERIIKPAVDLVGGLALFVLFLPLMLLTALAIMISLGRPVMYKQERIGRNGRLFQLYKFRTMIPDRRRGLNHYRGPERRRTHKSPNDPRVTGVCKVVRALRFDELPQLWNVIRGEMSLVGPRPELPDIVATYEHWQHKRHAVKPGLTGLWQVSALNGAPMHQCTDVDLRYIGEISLLADVSILLRTPSAMISRRGY